jgi:hypothetical protein
VSIGKRKRQKANRRARAEAEARLPEITDDELAGLLTELTVRVDCEHAHTRSTADAVVLTRCAVGAAVGGGCPVDCERFERRLVGGYGIGLGAG